MAARRRHELLDWLRQDAHRPLGEKALPPKERERIQARVQTGLIAQTWWHGVVR
jgi:hypothetical protein